MSGRASIRLQVWIALLLLLAHAQAQSPGHAVFQATSLAVKETSGTVGIPLAREGGATGALEATVSVDLVASNASSSRYNFSPQIVRWPDGDLLAKAIAVTVLNDNFYQPTEVVELVISDTTPGSVGIQRLQVWILPDEDGGVLSFTSGLHMDFTTISKVKEGFPPSPQCLAFAERLGGSSGVASVTVTMDCVRGWEDNFATPGVDYTFFPANEPVVWEDGENESRCILYSLSKDTEAPYPWQSAVIIWPDADSEDIENLCFTINNAPHSTAKLTTDKIEIYLQDGGDTGAGVTPCNLGAECEFNFTDLHFEPGTNISLQQRCTALTCRMNEFNVTSHEVTLEAAKLLHMEPGLWFACRCFGPSPAAQAITAVMINGPTPQNFVSCTMGWQTCSVQLLGEGLSWLPVQFVHVLHACPTLETNGTEVESYVDQHLLLGGFGTLDRSLSPGTWMTMQNPQEMALAGPGLFHLCWCSGGPGQNCLFLENFVVDAGLFEMEGPNVQADQQLTLGELYETNITGANLAPGDQLALQEACNTANVSSTTSDDGYFYRFGQVTGIPPGGYYLCWCRKGDGANCSHPDHWQPVGKVEVLCPRGTYSLGQTCTECHWPWDVPNAARNACQTNALRAVGVAVMFVFVTFATCLILCQIELAKYGGFKVPLIPVGRRIRIEDVSTEGEGTKLVMTSLGQHHLRIGTTFQVIFYGTNHFLLDGHRRRVTALDSRRLEITSLSGDVFVADASGGHFMLSLPGTFWYGQLYQVCPVMVLIVVLFAVGLSAIQYGSPPLSFVLILSAIELMLAFWMRVIYWKTQQYRSPLSRRVQQYNRILDEQHPKPKACPRGAQRAVTAFQLFDLYDFFQAFIKGRNMYYLDPNLVRPLTKKHRLSFAERVGPSQVDFFISHWWGTPFMNFCESVKRHAIHMCHSEDESDWKKIAYWICTFSNNQYRVQEELGGHSHEESSFYLALHSPKCKGTAMIMDEEASLLKRSWCLFELLQTVRKSEAEAERKRLQIISASTDSRREFAGMFFCTKTGVLNYGQATVEIAMKIGENIKNLSLEHATATSQEDKDMINSLVLKEMGSYDKINQILRNNLAEALRKCQEEVDNNFEGLFKGLKGEVHIDVDPERTVLRM
ncbi:Uncharacterized protein SCF082_LOCUS10906 [Durusdinium trenchii]|uniref:Uncharacterized protein n=1 Tax=Durusdinium trenchii TaxID=1381693 RepID=A0ABP0J9V3_9DINO